MWKILVNYRKSNRTKSIFINNEWATPIKTNLWRQKTILLFPRKLEVVWNSKKATAELADKTFLFVISDMSKKIIDAFLNSTLGQWNYYSTFKGYHICHIYQSSYWNEGFFVCSWPFTCIVSVTGDIFETKQCNRFWF